MSAATMTPPSKKRPGQSEENPPSGWLTPSKVMHKFRMRKRALAQRMTCQSSLSSSRDPHLLVSDDDGSGSDTDSLSFAAQNPFKIPRLSQMSRGFGRGGKDDGENGVDVDATICDALISPARKKVQISDSVENVVAELSPVLGILRHEIPVDWSLKSRVRCVFSAKNGARPPLDHRRTFSATEEASGITAFIRRNDIKSEDYLLDASLDARLRETTCYWQHPNLPWIQTFPRMGSGLLTGDAKMKAVSGSVATDQVLQKGLRRDWEDSLRSIYFMLKLKQCPYFYICASTFTCLFRAAGLDGSSEIQAFVCPTTKGMRDALTREEIIFSMPLKRPKNADAAGELEPEDKAEGRTESDDEEEAIESMLLSQIALAPDKSSSSSAAAVGKSRGMEAETSIAIDGKPESLVLIEAGDVQLFYGYFVGSRWGWNSSGPLAGVPPSIFAPTAFLGASLAVLKCRRNEIEEKGKRFTQLDIVGPIMPHVAPALIDLFSESPVDFELNLSAVPGTSSFNAKKPSAESDNSAFREAEVAAHARFSVQNLSFSGLSTPMLQLMCPPSTLNECPGLSGNQCLSKVASSRGSFVVS